MYENSLNFLFKEIEEDFFFFKGIFQNGFFFLKGKSSDDLPGDGVKHRNADFLDPISCAHLINT